MSKKPSPTQVKVLQRMASGESLHQWGGLGGMWYSRLRTSSIPAVSETVNANTVWALQKAGWVSIVKESWRDREFAVTDAGRAALAAEKGDDRE